MFDERPEITQQGFLPESRPQQQIPYFFSRYISHGWLTVRHKWQWLKLAKSSSCRLISRAALLLPVARPDAHSAAGTDIFALKAASENLPTTSFAMTGQCPSSFISLFLR